MDLFFADDAGQRNPSRPGMGPLVAIGGIHVPSQGVRDLEREIDDICVNECGFPPGEEFKWSPGPNLWMHNHLVEDEREEFFIRVLTLARDSGVTAAIVVEDASRGRATDAQTAEEDVVRLFLERVQRELEKAGTEGVIIVDRPSGGRRDEDKFLAHCLETLQGGTNYVKPDRIALNVVSTPSKLIRLLQVADVITSCTVATVGGENRFSPPIFEAIKPLLQNDGERIGGFGLKIHPDYVYANLYHWLVEDTLFVKNLMGSLMPLLDRPYSAGPNDYY